MSWVAYVDESMRSISGVYILAAACLEAGDCDETRATMESLTKAGQRFHWREEGRVGREKATGVVADLPALHLVVVGTSYDPSRQERARRHCMRRLLYELDHAGMSRVVLDARARKLMANDFQLVNALRTERTIGPELVVEHGYSVGLDREPLLWIPDIVAGAFGAELDQGMAVFPALDAITTRIMVDAS